MAEGILFLIVPTGRVANVERTIDKWIVPRARGAVKVLSDAAAASYSTNVGRSVAEGLIDVISAHPPHRDHRLIVERDVNCSIAAMKEWWEHSNFGTPEVKKVTATVLLRELQQC